MNTPTDTTTGARMSVGVIVAIGVGLRVGVAVCVWTHLVLINQNASTTIRAGPGLMALIRCRLTVPS